MLEFTQSDTKHGNCWQTALACILEVEPDSLPPQVEIEQFDHDVLDGWGSYHNVINGYLRVHHELSYTRIVACSFGAVRPVMPDHIICGPSVRTEWAKGKNLLHVNHCVVGYNGEAVWDVHPSGAMLTCHDEWGLLGPFELRFNSSPKKGREVFDLVMNCLCPKCGLDVVREKQRDLRNAKHSETT